MSSSAAITPTPMTTWNTGKMTTVAVTVVRWPSDVTELVIWHKQMTGGSFHFVVTVTVESRSTVNDGNSTVAPPERAASRAFPLMKL